MFAEEAMPVHFTFTFPFPPPSDPDSEPARVQVQLGQGEWDLGWVRTEEGARALWEGLGGRGGRRALVEDGGMGGSGRWALSAWRASGVNGVAIWMDEKGP